MSRREFSKVSPAVWNSKRFRAMETDRARLLLLYFLTSRHQNSAGCYKLPDGYAVADLPPGWTQADYCRERDALVAAGLVMHDPESEEIYIPGWFVICPPMNNKHASGTKSRIDYIESEDIRLAVEAEFMAADKARLVGKIKNTGGSLDADERPF